MFINNTLYKSKRWRRLRKYVLQRDGYQCQECKRYGKIVPADTVHHIYPADKYPELFFNPNNLISLSNKSHEKMHNRDSKEITQAGKRWQDKVKNKLF